MCGNTVEQNDRCRSVKPGPLRLDPVFLEKIWAEDSLPEPLSTLLGAGRGVGEVWLAGDRHHPTPVAEGQFKGLGLDEMVCRFPRWICGENAADGFPLLLKILSVGEWLSVQVHPGDEAARRLENEPRGKSEAWHVLAAEEGAKIVHGLLRGTDRARVLAAMEGGTIVDLLEYVAVRTGDTFHVPPLTVHSIGPGLTILEIQQSSDLTYRFFDWNRHGLDGELRPLHVDKATAVMTVTGAGHAVKPEPEYHGEGSVQRLVRDPRFTLLKCSFRRAHHVHGNGPWLLFFYQGCARLEVRGFETRFAEPGQTWMVPAGAGEWTVKPVAESAVLFEAHP